MTCGFPSRKATYPDHSKLFKQNRAVFFDEKRKRKPYKAAGFKFDRASSSTVAGCLLVTQVIAWPDSIFSSLHHNILFKFVGLKILD